MCFFTMNCKLEALVQRIHQMNESIQFFKKKINLGDCYGDPSTLTSPQKYFSRLANPPSHFTGPNAHKIKSKVAIFKIVSVSTLSKVFMTMSASTWTQIRARNMCIVGQSDVSGRCALSFFL